MDNIPSNQLSMSTRYSWNGFQKVKTPLVSLLICLILYWIAVRIVASIDYLNTDFFNNIWLGAHMVWKGLDPYNAAQWASGHQEFGVTWMPNPAFVYPLPLSILSAPFGLLSVKNAIIVWVFLSELVYVTTIYLVTRLFKRSLNISFLFPILLGIAFYRPTTTTLYLGQMGALLLLIIVLTVYLWEKERWLLGGLILPLLALKPSLGLPVIILIGLWALIRLRWTAILGMIISTVGLVCLGWLIDPKWIGKYLSVGNQMLVRSFGYTPTVWGACAGACKAGLNCILVAGASISAALLIISLVILLTRRNSLSPTEAACLAVPISAIITPYIWVYDQVILLLPILLIVAGMTQRGYSYILTAGLMPLVSLFALFLFWMAIPAQSDIWSVFNSVLVFIAGIWWVLKYSKSGVNRLTLQPQPPHPRVKVEAPHP
jgi:hypothetical protein